MKNTIFGHDDRNWFDRPKHNLSNLFHSNKLRDIQYLSVHHMEKASNRYWECKIL